MFSFHKPKVYRSINGCCICCAKSSSSRFTDSSKYELDFYKCFRIMEPRSGEICNACVLLVKRWQKLPPGSTRNWHHVVDARAGPGSKSIIKIKNKAAMEAMNKKHKYVKTPEERAQQNANRHHREQCAQEGMADLHIKRTRSSAYAPPPSPTLSENSDDSHDPTIQNLLAGSKISPFLDLSYWKCTRVCCGVIFKGPYGEVMVDPSLLRPCSSHKKPSSSPAPSQVPALNNTHNDRHSDGESSHSNESSRDCHDEDRSVVAKETDIYHGNEDTDIEEDHGEEDMEDLDDVDDFDDDVDDVDDDDDDDDEDDDDMDDDDLEL